MELSKARILLFLALFQAVQAFNSVHFGQAPTLFGYNGTGCLRIPSIPSAGYCGVPYSLKNFQGLYSCSLESSMARPKTLADVADVIKKYESVKAVGAGLSWNSEQFCPETGKKAIGIAMTELENLRPLFTQDPWHWKTDSPDFPIKVDKAKKLVTVDAGVPLRTLLNFLAYPAFLLRKPLCTLLPRPGSKLPVCDQGYYLKGVSQIMDTTVAGGVATSTHGSSMKHSTLSSQVVAMDVILANGSLVHFSEEKDPHLFRALQVNVGQLGVVARLTFAIVPQPLIKRVRSELTAAEAIEKVKALALAWKNGKREGKGLEEVMKENGFKDFIVLWFMGLDQNKANTWYLEMEVDTSSNPVPFPAEAEVLLQTLLNEWHDFGGAAKAKEPTGFEQIDTPPVPMNPLLQYGAEFFSRLFMKVVDNGLNTITAPALIGYPTLRPEWLAIWALVGQTKEYEVCVPLEEIGDAMEEMLVFFNTNSSAKEGFRTPTGFRLADEEPAYLASGNGGPRICMEIDDFTSLNSGVANWQLETVVQIMLKHKGRLHWGKSGMDEFGGCFRGAESWGDSWCHFGCAVQELDPPPRRFKSSSPIWKWFAKKDGTPVRNFGDCCTAEGFSPSCTCDAGPYPASCDAKLATKVDKDMKDEL